VPEAVPVSQQNALSLVDGERENRSSAGVYVWPIYKYSVIDPAVKLEVTTSTSQGSYWCV
jgi:hypothetical protein